MQSALRQTTRCPAIGAATILPQRSGLELYDGRLELAVGDDASSRENRMVEICVSVRNAAEANGLVARLAALFGSSAVSFDRIRNELRVRSEWESRSVVAVIDAVQSWLMAAGVDSAELSLGDRSYTMAAPTLIPEPERAAVAAGRHGARPSLNRSQPWSP